MAEPTVDTHAPSVKKCKQCQKTKPLSDFSPKHGHPDQLSAMCAYCLGVAKARYYRNQEKYQRIGREQYAKCREKRKAYSVQYSKSHASVLQQKRKAAWAKRRAENGRKPNAIRRTAEDRRRYAREWAKARRLKDVGAARARSRKNYWANPERYRKKSAKWIKEHPWCAVHATQLRKARLRASTVGDLAVIAAFYKKIRTANRLKCYWCNKPTSKSDRHVDHIIPITRNGKHAVENLCCSCASCNLRKSNKLPEEFNGQFVIGFSGSACS